MIGEYYGICSHPPNQFHNLNDELQLFSVEQLAKRGCVGTSGEVEPERASNESSHNPSNANDEGLHMFRRSSSSIRLTRPRGASARHGFNSGPEAAEFCLLLADLRF